MIAGPQPHWVPPADVVAGANLTSLMAEIGAALAGFATLTGVIRRDGKTYPGRVWLEGASS